MNKKSLNALGKIFAAEVSGTLPYQSKAKIYRDLEQSGHVEFGSEALLATRQCPWPLTVLGWYLTHLGRFIYCDSCRDIKDLEESNEA